MKKNIFASLIVFFMLFSAVSFCQESVFTGLKSDVKRADRYYANNCYKNALDLYLSTEQKKNGENLIYLKIGKTYYQLKEYKNAVIWYSKYLNNKKDLPVTDLYNYSEALRCTGNYTKAITYYKLYQKKHPEDSKTIEKIWRLNNIEFLMEDSIFYSVKLSNINSNGSEYSPVFYKENLIFVADKKSTGGVNKVDALNNKPFKTLYITALHIDTLNQDVGYKFTEPAAFGKGISSKYNIGSLSFFSNKKKIIFTKNGIYNKQKGSTLQLFIAKKVGNIWQEIARMPFNSASYSVSNPALNKDGTVLYFVSDMPGGFGGKDLYVSYYKNSKWSKPKNLGERINTVNEETAPFFHNDVLYFSSNGRGGLGGLDIYKIESQNISSGKIINLGYPINSSYDDFGIALNNSGARGFISSNRLNGGFDYNIYEIEINLKTYPLTIKGHISYKELNWKELDRFEILPNANLYLIDVYKKIEIGETKTDSVGNFEIEIPYASQFTIKIVSPSINEIVVSLDIPKNKKTDEIQNIVIVKDGDSSNKE